MNTYDSDTIKNILTQKANYEEVANRDDANLVIFNTCHIREKATETIYSELGKIKRLKIEKHKNGQEMIVAVVGCVAQAEGDLIKQRADAVDIVAGPETYHTFEKLIESAIKKKDVTALEFEPSHKFDYIDGELQNIESQLGKPSAYITIQEGCDRFCTFCVVPYTRGPEFSRKVMSIVNEARKLAESGTKEVILLGQNVNAYHGKDDNGKTWNIAKLISKIAEIDGIKRIRYVTSHPAYMDEELIAVHGSEEKLMPCLSLPAQSGANEILHKMNRQHTREQYIDLAAKLREVKPDITLSSDFIIDFPGETDQHFQDTVDFIKQVKFEYQSYSFKYSARPGTYSEKEELCDEEIRDKRLQIIQNLLEEQRFNFNSTFKGKTVKVLFESLKTRAPDQIKGRTEHGQIVIIKNLQPEERQSLYGEIKNVIIEEISENSMFGKVIN